MNTAPRGGGTYEWHIITCEYPPQIGGVSDCTATYAALLGAHRPTHVWGPAIDTAETAPPAGVTVHRDFGTFSIGDLLRVGRLLDGYSRPRRLFVQWVPHGYRHRSVNLAVTCWLLARAWWHHDDLQVLVHEPCAPFSLHPARLFAALVHRLMLVVVCLGASTVWESTPSWEPVIRPFLLGRTRPRWLPIPAATASTPPVRGAQTRTDRPLVIGHFGTFSPSVTPLLETALLTVLERSDARVRLIGRGSERFRTTFLSRRAQFASRIDASGIVPVDRLDSALAVCDVMVQPYPDGISARRTSTLALLRAGIPVVTNRGQLCEPFWEREGAVALAGGPDGAIIGDKAVQLLADTSARAGLASRARLMYERYFDTSHITSALVSGAAHTPWER
ncbi:MAG: glycosyltransferase [Vicinamibacterales bacterium]